MSVDAAAARDAQAAKDEQAKAANKARNPYPGLRRFEQGDAELYFGRDEQLGQLLDRIKRERLLAVVGGSGCGKSSLVRAGLIPALEGGALVGAGVQWRVVVTQPGDDPTGNLATDLAEMRSVELSVSAIAAMLGDSSMGLVTAARVILGDSRDNLLVVVDQFEEIFTFARDSERARARDEAKAFVKLLLAAAAQARVPIYVVLTMRSEFLGSCTQFRDLPEALNESQFLVPRLTRTHMQEAIEAPAGMRGARVTPRLVERLLNARLLNAEGRDEDLDPLPALQHALMRIWDSWCDRSDAHAQIDVGLYDDLGGDLGEVLNRHLDYIYNSVLPDEAARTIARDVFRQLVQRSPEGHRVRRKTPLAELASVARVSEERVLAVVDQFAAPARTFLVKHKQSVDISHESMIHSWNRLRDWVKKEEESAEIYRGLARASSDDYGFSDLYRRKKLADALDWRANRKPTPEWASRYDTDLKPEERTRRYERAMTFLKWSRRRQLVTRGLFGIPVVFLVLAGVGMLLGRLDENATIRAVVATGEQILADPNPATRLQEALRETIRAHSVPGRFGEAAKIKEALQLAVNAADAARSAGNFRERDVRAAAFSADGRCVAIQGYPRGTPEVPDQRDGSVKLFNTGAFSMVASGGVPPIYTSQTLFVDVEGTRVGVLYPPRIVETLATNGCLTTTTAATLGTRTAASPGLLAVAIARDPAVIATAAWDGTVNLWDAADRKFIRAFGANAAVSGRRAWDVTFDREARVLAVARDSAVELWDARAGTLTGTIGHPDTVRRVAFHPDGRVLATAGWDSTVRLWEVATRRLVRPLSGHSRPVNAVTFDPSGSRLASVGADGNLIVWEVATGRAVWNVRAHERVVQDVDFSPDGRWLVSAGADNKARIWDAATGQQLATLGEAADGHTGAIWSARYNDNGTLIVTASEDGLAKVWDAASGSHVRTLEVNGGPVNEAVFAWGDRVVTVGADDICRWWNWQTGQEDLRVFGHHLDREIVDAVAPSRGLFEDDGSLVALGTDGSVFRIDGSGAVDPMFDTEQPGVRELRFSSNGLRLATIADGSIQVWQALLQVGLDRPVAWTVAGGPFDVADEAPVRASLNQDGTMLAVVGKSGVPTVWAVGGARPGITMRGTAAPGTDVALSARGDLVGVTGRDGTLRVWSVQTRERLVVAAGAYRWLTFTTEQEPLTRGSAVSRASDPAVQSRGESARSSFQGDALVAVGTDGGRIRLARVSETDVARLVGRGFLLIAPEYGASLDRAIGLALTGSTSAAIFEIQQLDGQELDKAVRLRLLEKFQQRSFAPADLAGYF